MYLITYWPTACPLGSFVGAPPASLISGFGLPLQFPVTPRCLMSDILGVSALTPLRRPHAGAKRSFDVIAALTCLLVLSPLLLAVAVAVRLTMGRPILFTQIRPGYLEKPFTIVKFRTMRDAVDSCGEQLPDGKRLHAFGTFLRKSSLDELPELWNVLKGDMSLVGPRPLLMRYLPYYTDEERVRFTVRPGITGWAQVNGRNEASWTNRLRSDVWYVENQSFWLDIRILFMTIAKVLTGDQVVVDARSRMLNLDEERSAGKCPGNGEWKA